MNYPPPQILPRTCLLPLCCLSASLIIAMLIKFSADSTESEEFMTTMFATLSSSFCMLYLWNTSFYTHELHSHLLKERIHYHVSNNSPGFLWASISFPLWHVQSNFIRVMNISSKEVFRILVCLFPRPEFIIVLKQLLVSSNNS